MSLYWFDSLSFITRYGISIVLMTYGLLGLRASSPETLYLPMACVFYLNGSLLNSLPLS